MLVFAYTQSVNACVFAPERGFGRVRQRGTVQISIHYSDGCVTGFASGCDNEVPVAVRMAFHPTNECDSSRRYGRPGSAARLMQLRVVHISILDKKWAKLRFMLQPERAHPWCIYGGCAAGS